MLWTDREEDTFKDQPRLINFYLELSEMMKTMMQMPWKRRIIKKTKNQGLLKRILMNKIRKVNKILNATLKGQTSHSLAAPF